MSDFAHAFLAITTPTAIITTVLFGMMIGAFYGYELESRLPPEYPFQFWVVGIVFVVILALLNLAGETAAPLPNSVARGVLWTFLCGAIPIGRWLRIRWATRRRK